MQSDHTSYLIISCNSYALGLALFLFAVSGTLFLDPFLERSKPLVMLLVAVDGPSFYCSKLEVRTYHKVKERRIGGRNR